VLEFDRDFIEWFEVARLDEEESIWRRERREKEEVCRSS